MNNMTNLNKENFFNQQMIETPKAMAMFCKWIDEYKKEVGWDYLFNNYNRIVGHPEIKFHDIAFELQIGVLQRFFREQEIIGHIIDTSDIKAAFEQLEP